MLDTVKKLCALPGVSGWEDEVRDRILEQAMPHADEIGRPGFLSGGKKISTSASAFSLHPARRTTPMRSAKSFASSLRVVPQEARNRTPSFLTSYHQNFPRL